MNPALLAPVAEIGSKLIDRFFPDKSEEDRRQLSMFLEVYNGQMKVLQADAASQHWLAANWRPILFLTFGWLIVSRWYGWTAPKLSEAEYLKLWDIMQFALTGGVIGRTIEKVAPMIADMNKR